jgi:outer membrane protein OmpA-like peptidoglycan-associated protein/Tol biopolymer transport system component
MLNFSVWRRSACHKPNAATVLRLCRPLNAPALMTFLALSVLAPHIAPLSTVAQPKKKLTAKLLQVQGVSITKIDVLSSTAKEANITLSPSGRFMYFMSERGGQAWSEYNEGLKKYDGDLWYAERVDGQWQKPVSLNETINTGSGEDEPNITPDGQNVYFQSFRNGWKGIGGPYFMAELHGKKWDNLTGLGGPITSFFSEQYDGFGGMIATDGSSFSPAGTLFLFTSGKDYKSPMDIFYSRRSLDGAWSQVEKLDVSTPKNERSVFIAADGKTIYFASNGYGGAGGLDIFKATINDDGTVGNLYNLGEAFNTKGDDYGFVLSADGKEAYFLREGDIYHADLSAVESPELKPTRTVVITGFARSKATGNPLEASIDISEIPATGSDESGAASASANAPTTGMYSISIRSNSVSGEYTAVLKPNKRYMVSASASKHRGLNKEFVLNTDNSASGIFVLNLEMEPTAPRPPKVKANTTATASIRTGSVATPSIGLIFFNSDEFTIEEQYLDELDKAWEFLKANPQYQAEILGFADDRGSYEYNLRLSQRRVNAVVDYLWSLGCERKRLALKFFGEEEPVASNVTPDGRSRNRRAELSFFRKAEDTPKPAVPAVKSLLPTGKPADVKQLNVIQIVPKGREVKLNDGATNGAKSITTATQKVK